MEPILEAQELRKTFPGRDGTILTALDGVSFALYPGQTLGIVGESGSGKSTLARVLTRLTEPAGGTVRLLGRDLTAARGRELRRAYRDMQMVFQSPQGSLDPRRTVGFAVGESLVNLGLPRDEIRQRVGALLQSCGLPGDFARRYPHELSGGQCQRAAIARALAAEPKILICAEATSALDVTVQQQILELLTRLKGERGLAYLFICHDLALVQSFCDRVLVMHAGRVVEEGSPEELIAHPRSPYTKALVDAAL